VTLKNIRRRVPLSDPDEVFEQPLVCRLRMTRVFALIPDVGPELGPRRHSTSTEIRDHGLRFCDLECKQQPDVVVEVAHVLEAACRSLVCSAGSVTRIAARARSWCSLKVVERNSCIMPTRIASVLARSSARAWRNTTQIPAAVMTATEIEMINAAIAMPRSSPPKWGRVNLHPRNDGPDGGHVAEPSAYVAGISAKIGTRNCVAIGVYRSTVCSAVLSDTMRA
jgi:hypothetical protein